MRSGYWVIFAFWAIVMLGFGYYASGYSVSDFVPHFDGAFDFLTWLVAIAFLLLPLLLHPFFRQK